MAGLYVNVSLRSLTSFTHIDTRSCSSISFAHLVYHIANCSEYAFSRSTTPSSFRRPSPCSSPRPRDHSCARRSHHNGHPLCRHGDQLLWVYSCRRSATRDHVGRYQVRPSIMYSARSWRWNGGKWTGRKGGVLGYSSSHSGDERRSALVAGHDVSYGRFLREVGDVVEEDQVREVPFVL